MAYSNRRSKRPIAGICPCHGSAPHVYVKKSATTATDPKKGSKGPRKGTHGGRAPQGRPSYPARGGQRTNGPRSTGGRR